MQPTPSAPAPPDWFVKALDESAELGATVVDGVSISHRAWGQAGAPGVVLVHGGLAHARWWDHVAPMLTGSGRRRVLALDLSGHGESGRRERYGMETWAREVAEVAVRGGFPEPPVVVGHSMGGLVALHAAVAYGGLVGGTVAIDSRVFELSATEVAENEVRARTPPRVYPTRRAAVARFRPVPAQHALPYVRTHVAETSVRASAEGWTWKFDPRIFGGQEFDNRVFAKVDGRVLVLRAEHGISPAGVEELVRLAGGVPCVEIPAAGHHVMLDQPLALVAALRTVLADWQPVG
ncbi:MAG: alpha/beta hydrolase [Nocardioidaceae bacterium]|nr:alpha/beta hydrolase [Nocardioidaceae bacterium]